MQLSPYINRIPIIYDRLSKIYPDKPWLQAFDRIQQKHKAFPFQVGREQFDNCLVTCLTSWERQPYKILDGFEWEQLVSVMMLADNVGELCQSVREGKGGPIGLESRFRGAIKNPADARAIQFELSLATYFNRIGCQITWPDESKGDETFDLLIKPQKGFPEFELECKSFSGEKGSPVTMQDGFALAEACIKANIFEVPSRPPTGYAAILTVLINQKLNTDNMAIELLAAEIVANFNEVSKSSDVFEIRYDCVEVLGDPENPDSCLEAAEGLLGVMLAPIVTRLDTGQWQCLRVAWNGSVNPWSDITKVAKRACDKQLTKKRPGVIALQFTNDTLESFDRWMEPENKYRRLASELLTRPHLSSVLFTHELEIRFDSPRPPYAPKAFPNDGMRVCHVNRRYCDLESGIFLDLSSFLKP